MLMTIFRIWFQEKILLKVYTHIYFFNANDRNGVK